MYGVLLAILMLTPIKRNNFCFYPMRELKNTDSKNFKISLKRQKEPNV